MTYGKTRPFTWRLRSLGAATAAAAALFLSSAGTSAWAESPAGGGRARSAHAAEDDGEAVEGGEGKTTLVKVENTGDLEVRLYEITGSAMAVSGSYAAMAYSWRPVCVAPCSKRLDLSDGRDFFVGGDEATGSRRFNLSSYADKDEVTVEVTPGPLSKTRAGVWMLISGAGVAGLGASFALSGALALAMSANDSPYAYAPDERPGFPIGGAFLIAGAVLAAVGVPLLISGLYVKRKGRTDVSIH
ncbi:MAG TPA: phage holin family protein [Myxococcota bacterium]|jgi:hypothetical protein|nr:phage holin family protein [Myxococcota bacterium]